ncbi:MAG: hypothetical protein UU22_C0036G0005 [Parcubacteria group bacterium GW2011_GWA2_40_8]|nr:MAG: hypothetical protein UT82_C0019G0015 [Parcubacteria group bacterium GW2011_GWB1_40_14]KKR77807.1 MAG: hypothetical protein UU22_C0036G0005 [Parcubacteria group bacterium GW2011_GWA2_40_8]
MTVIKHTNQRVAVLVDVQNLYHSAKHMFSARVNYQTLLEEVVAGRMLVRSLAYVVKAGDLAEEQAFFDALTKAGFEVKSKDLQVFAGGMKKADWDVGLAVDAIRLSSLVDAIILVTGDGDFIPLVEFLKMQKGVQVEVAAFGRSASAKLKEAADDFLDLGQSQFLIKINKRPRSRR